ncbi:carbohydrate sulfotransferase 9-like [Mercenaria mercenaria]|uniref:carbohydrate sulfotransferase 9-like n=1 Tax=Mercenaria mercenaria TaxID=6596 RepID=UPI00234F240B|nr:carbohydrate sulfotransferase 9-like [Mercenaria mercenaria]
MDLYIGHKIKRIYTCKNKTFSSVVFFLMLILALVITHTCISLSRAVINKSIKLRSEDNNMHLPSSRYLPELRTEGNNTYMHSPSTGSPLVLRNDDDANDQSIGSLHELRNDNNVNSPSTGPQSKLRSDDKNMNRPTTGSNQIYNFQTTIARNAERKKRLQQRCSTSDQKERINVTKKHEFFKKERIRILTNPLVSVAYCRVSKAASWYTINALGKILNCTEECLRSFSERIRMLSYERKREALNNAYKFMFVREPYGRLFSTYCNKFYFPKGYWSPVGIDIIRRFRENPSEDSLVYGHDVTFAELIRYTIEDFEAGNKMDAHIRPMHTNCKPCDYDYDFIGKLETMQSDWKYLAHEWKSRNITTNIPTDIGEKSTDIFGEMIHVHVTLKKIEDSNITLYDLYQRAWNYYQITSVISKRISMPLSRSDNRYFGYYSLLYHLKRARMYSEQYATEMKAQRHEAMLQAYSTVPSEDLERLKSVVKEDCLLFGYDDSPEWLFGRKIVYNKLASFDYFSGINGDKTFKQNDKILSI